MITRKLLTTALLITASCTARAQGPVLWLQAYGAGTWNLYNKGAEAEGVELRPGAGLLVTGERMQFSVCWEHYNSSFTWPRTSDPGQEPLSLRTSGNAFPALLGVAITGPDNADLSVVAGPVLYFNQRLEGNDGQGWQPYSAEQRTGLAIRAALQWDHALNGWMRLQVRTFMELQAVQTFTDAPLHYPPANYIGHLPDKGPLFGLSAGLAFGLPRQ